MKVLNLLRTATLSTAVLLSSQTAAVPASRPEVRITVEPLTTGEWRAAYRFDAPASAWLFTRSAREKQSGRPWRSAGWTVETAGVRLERWGEHDVLTSPRPVKALQVRFRPDARPLATGQIPALTFSDGGLALYTGQFEVAPLASANRADARPSELAPARSAPTPIAHLQVRAPGRRLLVHGRAFRDEAVTRMNAQTYVYMGEGALTETPALTAVIDPGLPRWIASDVRERTSRLAAWYAERLGAPAARRPFLYAAWGGDQHPGGSMHGAVVNGLVVMSMRGGALAEPNPRAAALSDWFTAHEIAHFWVGQTVGHSRPDEAWITEGGADLLAVRAAQHLRPTYDARARLQQSLDGCVGGVAPGESLSAASALGKAQANYDCGAVLLLAAEGALRKRRPGADALDFWRDLLDRRRAERVVSETDWLDAFTRATGDAALTEQVRVFLDRGVDDPPTFLQSLLTAGGVPVARASETRLVLL